MKSFKDLSWKLKEELEAKGVNMPASQLMDALAKALDFKSYDQAKALPEKQVMGKITSYAAEYPLSESQENVKSVGEHTFDITVSVVGVLKKSLCIPANSPQDARDKALAYLVENEDYCRDSGVGWSFDYIESTTACVTELYQSLAKEGFFSNQIYLTPTWDLENTLRTSNKELAKDFDQQITEFRSLEDQLILAAHKVLSPHAGLSALQEVVAGLKHLKTTNRDDLAIIRKKMGMSFYKYMEKKFDFKGRDADSWKETFDFIKSLG